MIRLGETQKLIVVKKVEFGIYLSDSPEKDAERILLPVKQVPENTELNQEIEVFVYKDSSDRLIATTRTPLVTLGHIARLKVVELGKIGAFLDWGLEKDLFLPFKEQTKEVKTGESILVALYIDKSSRLCATMNVYPYLDQNSPYKKEEWVTGTIYESSDNFGLFVAVDDKYSGLIAKKEIAGDLKVGDTVRARVLFVKEDGKLNLAVREKSFLQIGTDADKVMEIIEGFDGALPFNDKANPEVIRRETGMSKNEFKRAVGNLLKAGRIEITERSIRKIK
ncbi:MAG: S1-like domain-containing RNA-binding protein [Lachnospiraceae bacterium]|nr:S1-like domain-containing RNA-binding protein [Lachnospiraceae bacterium]